MVGFGILTLWCCSYQHSCPGFVCSYERWTHGSNFCAVIFFRSLPSPCSEYVFFLLGSNLVLTPTSYVTWGQLLHCSVSLLIVKRVYFSQCWYEAEKTYVEQLAEYLIIQSFLFQRAHHVHIIIKPSLPSLVEINSSLTCPQK